jgi:hypothetical protein
MRRSSHPVARVTAVLSLAVALAGCTASGNSTSSQSPSPSGIGSSASASARPSATAAPSAPPTATAPAPEPTYSCPDTQDWTTATKSRDGDPVPEALYNIRVGRHTCYDRIVFDINGRVKISYVVGYVPQIKADPSDQLVAMPAGTTPLQVVIRAPILGADASGHQPWHTAPKPGDDLVDPKQFDGLPSLRAARFAGSFENHTTIGVAVTSRLAPNVTVWQDGSITHVIVDVAHPPTP